MSFCKVYDCSVFIVLQLLDNCSWYLCVEIFLYPNIFYPLSDKDLYSELLFLYWTQYWTLFMPDISPKST